MENLPLILHTYLQSLLVNHLMLPSHQTLSRELLHYGMQAHLFHIDRTDIDIDS